MKKERLDISLIPMGWSLEQWMMLADKKYLVIDNSEEVIGRSKNSKEDLEQLKSEGYTIINLAVNG